jgi:hypothetical protein
MKTAPSKRARGHLYATATAWVLHVSGDCCGGTGRRKRVRDHYNPSAFDSDAFVLCPEAVAEAVQRASAGEGEAQDG